MNENRAMNVVLGYATNLLPERIELLAKTLRHVYTPQQCDLVIYTNKVDNELSRIAQEYSVDFIYTPNTYSSKVSKFSKLINRCIIYPTKFLARLTKNIPSLNVIFYELYPQLLKLWHHPHFVRWLSYQEFLKINPHYNHILITDIKDVAFQSPCFENLEGYDLHFFKQDTYYGGEDYWDSQWYKQSYGSEAFKKVVGKPAICIGTIIGSSQGIKSFVDIFCDEFLQTPFIGVEQSVFNHMIFEDKFSSITLKTHENTEGPVLTLNPGSLHRFRTLPDGLVSNDGKLIPIVHMYDRNKEAFEHFSRKFNIALNEDGLIN